MSEPRVSVIIPTYNDEELVNDAVNSALSQTYTNIEVIVVNDNPEINISEYLSSGHNSVTIISHDQNKGGAAARNTGFEHASGDYVAFLDADDLFLPTKIGRQMRNIESHSDEWIGTYTWSYSEQGDIRASSLEGDLTFELLSLDPDLLIGGSSSLLLKADIVSQISGFDESFERHQEWEFLIRCFEHGKLAVVREPLFIKRGGNPPTADRHLEIERQYLGKFWEKINAYPSEDSNAILGAHMGIISTYFFKERRYLQGLKYFLKMHSYTPPFQPVSRYFSIARGVTSGIFNKIIFS